ncbi:MAG: hypothetical protein M1541_11015 [Acidobacteria bacterium]|nr:hypothetical protein [Acidobacteriota bacterium]
MDAVIDQLGRRTVEAILLLRIKPSQLCVEQIDATLILGFLAHIEEKRRNCAATPNGRLAAVKAFIRYVEFRVPSALAQARQIHAIPSKRHDQVLVRHFTMDEIVDPSEKLETVEAVMPLGCVAGDSRCRTL